MPRLAALGGEIDREVGAASGVPFLGEDGPALVVAPAAADLQVAGGEAFAPEAGGPGERERGLVAGLDVRLETVQPHDHKRMPQRKVDPLSHVSLPRVALPHGVSEVRALERAV